MTPAHVRRAVIADAQAVLAAAWPDTTPGANCINAAAAVCIAAHKYGLVVMPQGGSTSWPRLRIEDDDGVSATHFSYEYEARGNLRAVVDSVLARGAVPEIHAWAVVLASDGPEVVDLTVPYWPRRCAEVLGLPWTAPQPPPFLWADEDEVVARRCRYAADPEATALVGVLIANFARTARERLTA